MAERALAHIEKIEWIKPIEGADNIELIGLLGWACIAKKAEFNVGDLAVYVEIDSKVPDTDERFAFLESKHYKVKTLKLGKFKVISQGLALPITLFPELSGLAIGTDVTEKLKITYSSEEDIKRKSNKVDPEAKYKSMANRHPKIFKKPIIRKIMNYKLGRKVMFLIFGRKKDNPRKFPDWIVKTDEQRCLYGDTKIWTEIGRVRIADIVNKHLELKVLSYNHTTKKLEYKPIVSYQRYEKNEDWVKIVYGVNRYGIKSNSIICTNEHKFYTENGYIEAKDLKVGQKIYNRDITWDNDGVQFALGLLLGDSHVSIDTRLNQLGTQSPGTRVSLTQGVKQLDYLKEKIRLLDGDLNKIKNICSGYTGKKTIYTYHFDIDNNLTNTLYDLGCIQNNKFTITKQLCDRLNASNLAIWYLDDGTLRHRNDNLSLPAIQISTNSETYEENELLIQMLKERFGIECGHRKDKSFDSVYMTANGTRKFLEMVTPYIPYSMRYKTLKEFENMEYVLENKVYHKKDTLLENIVRKIEVLPRKSLNYKKSYDLEIADNHNFFANNILTHNCENTPWVLEGTEKWIKSEKIDGTSTTTFIDFTKNKKGEFGVCSRNVRQQDEKQECYHTCGNVYWEMVGKYNIEDALRKIAKEHNVKRVVLQGETYGDSIQGNPYKLNERRFAAFNLIFDGERLGSVEAKNVLQEYNIPFVPIIDTEYELPKTMEEMKLEADGYSEINPKVKREGFVYRSLDGKRSFKNVSREYLLKHNG